MQERRIYYQTKYNQTTGQYEKNPNEGAAFLEMVDNLGNGIGVEGDAETAVPWRYTAYEVSASVEGGDIFVGGTPYHVLSYSEGRDVVVYYRGRGGYRINRIIVDGVDVPITEENTFSYTFRKISVDHTIRVEYTPYYGSAQAVDSEYVYDGEAHVYPVELEGWDNAYSTEVRYSLTDSEDDADYYSAEEFAALYGDDPVTYAGTHTLYYRVYALQPGYGETLEDEGWVWVAMAEGTGQVTIRPRPLSITAKSFRIGGLGEAAPPEPPYPGPYRGVTVDYLVEGDVINTNDVNFSFTCPTYQNTLGQY